MLLECLKLLPYLYHLIELKLFLNFANIEHRSLAQFLIFNGVFREESHHFHKPTAYETICNSNAFPALISRFLHILWII